MRRSLALLLLPAASAFMNAGAHAEPSPPGISMSAEETKVPPGTVMVPGQLSTLFKINDADPEANVPTPSQRTGNPLEFGYYLQDILARAQAAQQRHDQESAIKYLRALAAAIPEQAKGWSMLCAAYETAHDRDRALRACKYALERPGVDVADYQRYVGLMVAKPGDLSDDETGALKAVFDHLDTQPDLAVTTAHLRCQAAIKTKDTAAMQACTTVLAKVAPDDPKTIVFQWSFAVMRGDGAAAAQLLERAKKAGVASENIERMSRVERPGRSFSRGLGVMGGAALLLALLVFVRFRRRVGAPDRLAP